MVAASLGLAPSNAVMAAGEAKNADEVRAVFRNAPVTQSLPASKGGTPEQQRLQVSAQEAAAKAPDTASADAAKKRVLEQGGGDHQGRPR
jgi:hypothetical protein